MPSTPFPLPNTGTTSKLTAAVSAAPNPSVIPNNSVVPQRKFGDMDVLERVAVTKEIGKKDIGTIFQLFLDAGRVEHDPIKQSGIQGVFTRALKSQPLTPEFLEKMRQFVSDKSNSRNERESIMSSFAFAGTKETAEFLQWAATSPDVDEVVRTGGRSGIAKMGSVGPGDYIPPIVQPLWRNSKDQYTLNSAAEAMAKAGEPSGIELLLSAALAPDGQDDMRRDVATWALQEVYTANAVPPLAAALKNNPVGSRANTLAFTTLAQIVEKKADQVLMGWLQTNDGSAASMAKEWIAHAKTPSQLVAAKAALDPSVPFRSEANREALRAGLEAYRAGHK